MFSMFRNTTLAAIVADLGPMGYGQRTRAVTWICWMAAVAMGCIVSPAFADQIAVVDETGGVIVTEIITSAARGWGFELSQPVTLTALGVWDDGGDGLTSAHTVDLWNGGATLLSSARINAGTVAAAAGGVVQGGVFRYEPITPIVLAAGTQYIVAMSTAHSDGDHFINFGGTTTTDPLVTINEFRLANLGGFAFPDRTFGGTSGYFGPNFEFTAIAEPGSFALLGIAVAAVGFMRRRKAA
jgi:hypothetical protein